MRNAPGMARCASARKTGYREIETAPEKMDRAGLAEKAGAELFEHPVDAYKNLQKPLHGVRIVGGMLVIIRKPDWIRQFVRHVVDRDVNAEFGERSSDRRVEFCNVLSSQPQSRGCAGAGEADLPDDLGKKMQRHIGVAPPGGRQFRPRGRRGPAHASPLPVVIGKPT